MIAPFLRKGGFLYSESDRGGRSRCITDDTVTAKVLTTAAFVLVQFDIVIVRVVAGDHLSMVFAQRLLAGRIAGIDQALARGLHTLAFKGEMTDATFGPRLPHPDHLQK